ncbi:MAG: hypothetical protein OXK80_04835 [Bdellovibrionales bacterium]|nr:hypothetical protein [Bdellovibrionales bacterium]
MKQIILTGLLVCGLFAHADTDRSNDNSGFFALRFGLNINQTELTVKKPRYSLTYGADLHTQDNYIGFFELGIQEVLALSLQYGYEFMRENTLSLGLQISLSTQVLDDDALGFGNDIGAFTEIKISNSVSSLVHIGVQQQRLIKDGGDWNFSPYIDVGVRYYLN